MKNKLRGFVSSGLIISWSIVAMEGIILYFSPKGPGLGRGDIFLGFNRSEITFFHSNLGLIAIIFSLFHIILEWKVFLILVKNLFKGKQD